MALEFNNSISIMDDVLEMNIYESFGEVAALAAELLRDWPEELQGQRELRRLAEDIAVHFPTCPEETEAAEEKILENIDESWLNEPLTITECINPGAPVPRPLLLQRDNDAPVPIERVFAHASNEMPLYRPGTRAVYEDPPFILQFDSDPTRPKVVGHPEIVSFEPEVPPGAPSIKAGHLVQDVNGDILSITGELTKEDRDAILSGEWTIEPAASSLERLPSRSKADHPIQGLNPVVFNASTTDADPTSAHDSEAPIPSTSNGSVLPGSPSQSTLLSTIDDSAMPTSLPLSDDHAEQEVNSPSHSPSPLDQAVVLFRATPPSAPSESISPSSHAISEDAATNGQTSMFAMDSNTSDASNSKSPFSSPGRTSLGVRKRGLTSDLGPGSDNTDEQSPKRQRGIDGQAQQPLAATSSDDGPHRTPRFGGPPSQGQFGANSSDRQSSPPRFKPMLPYNAKTGRKLRREGAFIEKDFGERTAWLPNPPPHAYSDDPAHTAPRPLKRTGAGYGLRAGNRVKWFPHPPASGYYGRSYRDPTPPRSAPVNATRSARFFGQGSNTSDNVQPTPTPSTSSITPANPAPSAGFLGQGSSTSDVQLPPSSHNAIPPPAIPEGVDIDDLALEYVDDPSLDPPAATNNLAAPSSSWVPPPMPQTPTPASRTSRHTGSVGARAPAPSADTRKRSRDDDEDEDESLRPTTRIRSSRVPLPGPSRFLMPRLPPLRIPPVAANSSSQIDTTTIAPVSPEAPPPRRSSRLARAAKKLRK